MQERESKKSQSDQKVGSRGADSGTAEDAPRIRISKRLYALNAFSSVAAKLINISIFVGLFSYLSAKVETDEFSLYPIAQSIGLFLPFFSELFTNALARYTLGSLSKKDSVAVGQIVSSAAMALVASCLPAALLCALLLADLRWLRIPPGLFEQARWVLVLIFGQFAVATMAAPFSVGLFACQRYVLINLLNLAQQCLRLGLIALFFWTGGPRIVFIFAAGFLAAATTHLLRVYTSLRLVPELKFRFGSFRWHWVRQLASFGGWTMLARIADYVRFNIDPLLVTWMTGSAMLAVVYGASNAAVNGLNLILAAVLGPMTPPFVIAYARGGIPGIRENFLKCSRYMLWIALGLSLPVFVFSPQIARIWLGGQYEQAAAAIRILMLVYPFAYAVGMLPTIAISTAKVKRWSCNVFAIQSLKIGIAFLAVRHFGWHLTGVATATLTAMAAGVIFLQLPLLLKITEVKFSRYFMDVLAVGATPWALCLWPGFAIANLFAPKSVFELISCVAANMVLYSFFVLVVAARTDKDRLHSALRYLHSLKRKTS